MHLFSCETVSCKTARSTTRSTCDERNATVIGAGAERIPSFLAKTDGQTVLDPPQYTHTFRSRRCLVCAFPYSNKWAHRHHTDFTHQCIGISNTQWCILYVTAYSLLPLLYFIHIRIALVCVLLSTYIRLARPYCLACEHPTSWRRKHSQTH